MANFTDSYNNGIHNANDRDIKLAEVESVFNELSTQIQSETDQKITISRLARSERIDASNFFAMAVISNMKYRKYVAICAVLSDQMQEEDLAEFEMHSENIYPCKIKTDSYSVTCLDKKALESALEELLSLATTGLKFRKLLNN